MFTLLQILLFQANAAVTSQARTLSILWDTEDYTPLQKHQYNYEIDTSKLNSIVRTYKKTLYLN